MSATFPDLRSAKSATSLWLCYDVPGTHIRPRYGMSATFLGPRCTLTASRRVLGSCWLVGCACARWCKERGQNKEEEEEEEGQSSKEEG